MRVLAWIGLALVLLLAVGIMIADRVVTGMVNRDPLRSQIDELVDEALGRDVEWKELGVGLLPPSLVIEEVTVAGTTADAPPLAEAESIQLRVALVPLLARAVVVDSLFVRGAKVRLVLTEDGFELPEFGGGEADAEAEEPEAGESETSLAIRSVELVDAHLLFDDRSVTPSRGFELVDIDARIEGSGLEDPFDLEISIESKEGGRATVEGSAWLDHELDLVVKLDEFPLLPLDPYLAAADELKGRVTGTVSIEGPFEAPRQVTGELEVADAVLRFQDTVIEGPISWRLQHSGPWGAPNGSFYIDATRARASLAGIYEKAPGRPASIQGKLVTKDGVIGFDEVELKIENVDAQGRLDLGKRMHASFQVAPIEVGHWQPLLKPLADFEVSGRLSTDRWEIWSEPVEIKGTLNVEQVSVSGPGGREFVVDGRVVAGGGAIRTEHAVLETAGQRLPVEAELTDLDGDWRFRVRAKGEQLDSDLLLTKVAGRPDTLHGPLDLDGDLFGALAGQVSPLRSLGGRTRFRVAPGKLKGISILEATMKQFELLGGRGVAGLLGGPLVPRRGFAPALSDYYKDDFLVLSASLTLKGGVASTNDLHLLTEGYEFKMQGKIDLEDLGLDARGEIKLGEELTRSIARIVGLQEMPLMQAIVIPIPRLRGTVSDPRPEPDFSFLLRALTGNLPGAKGVQKLLEGLEGVLRQPARRP